MSALLMKKKVYREKKKTMTQVGLGWAFDTVGLGLRNRHSDLWSASAADPNLS